MSDDGGDQSVQPMGQTMLGGMPRRLYSCTPTRLTTWLDCPRRYRWIYLDRPQPARGAPWAHTGLGAAVHVALASWWNLPVPQRSPEQAAALVAKGFPGDGYRDEAQRQQACRLAAGWVYDYAQAQLSGPDGVPDPVGVERTVSSPTQTLVVSGRVDRIDLRGGRLVIVDYKTGRRPCDDDEARSSLALALYAVAAARTLHHPAGRVELHHLPSGTTAVAEHDEVSLTRKVKQAESIAYDASRADAGYREGRQGDDAFEPRPSRACSWCDFRQHCREGQAAAPQIEPWSGLPEQVRD